MGGAERIVVQPAGELPRRDWAWECSDLCEAWPYLGPTWLSATARVLPGAEPLHTVAHRHEGEVAYLPGFLLREPAGVDFDPRTYLGWQDATGDEVCCGVETCADTVDEVEALGRDAFFPTLLVGSPLGYRSEAAFTFWTPALFGQLVDGAIEAAREHGARSVIAPWIPQRIGNEHVTAAFERSGGTTAFWGFEDYIDLTGAPDHDAYVAAMPARRRRRLKEDLARIERAGVRIERLNRAELVDLIGRVAELTCANREKNGAGERPEHIEGLLGSLLMAGADVRCWAARKDGDVVGTCVGIRKGDRLFIKWVGFDYAALGERSGVYFGLVLDAPVRDACAEGLRFVECGAGAHQSKALRGCLPRRKRSAVWVADERLRADVARLVRTFGEHRQESFGVRPAAPALPLVQAADSACCTPSTPAAARPAAQEGATS